MKNARIRLGQEILRRRKVMGMTQEELASRMGISRQSVAKWETGQSSPDIDRLVLLREVLQTSLDELIGPAGREPLPAPVPAVEGSLEPATATPERTFRLLPLILGMLLFCCGLGGLAALVDTLSPASGPPCGLGRFPAYRAGRIPYGDRPLACAAAGLHPARLRQPHAALPVEHTQKRCLNLCGSLFPLRDARRPPLTVITSSIRKHGNTSC